MKRHFSRLRCSAAAGVFIAGPFILTSVASETIQPGIFIAGERGFTFYNSILSGSSQGRFALWNRWESGFRFGRPSLFGIELLPAASGFPQFYQSGLALPDSRNNEQSPPVAVGFVKLSEMELRWNKGTKHTGRIKAGKISMVQPEMPGFPGRAGTEFEIVAIVDSSAEVIPLISSPVTQSPAEGIADVVAPANPPPERRPKPPLPPRLPIVSR